MKLFKSRKLSIVLALVLVLTSFSFTAMADTAVAEDFTIIGSTSDIGKLNQVKGLTDKDTESEYYITTEANYTDPLLNKTVLRYSAAKYGISSGTWNTAGTEPRIATNTEFENVGFTADKYDYVKIEFNIYIEDITNGLAFRMQRYTPGATDMGNYCYIGVGGSGFKVGGGTLAGSYINTTLEEKAWNNVVIELGADTSNKDVIFHVNGVSTVCGTKLPDNTYGFGGGNSSRCVMIPKGYKDKPFEIRLDDFSIVATNTKHIYSSGYLINKFVNRNTVSSQVSAVDFSETYNKKALRVENNYFKTTDGVTKQTGLTGGPGQEAGFRLNSIPDGDEHKNDLATLGDLDWSKYKNLRIQFNAYFDYENIIYIRFVRSLDGGETYDNKDNIHVVGVGTPAKPGVADNNTNTANTSGASSGCNYRYREMTPNEWHNVVMELGANKDNKYVNIYIDGKPVTPDKTVFTNWDKAEGFGTVGRNNLFLALRDTADSFLDAQISDISFVASNSMYTPAAAPSIDGVTPAKAAPTESTAGLTYRVDTEKKAITYVDRRDEDGMSVADFKVSDVDYVGANETNTKVIAYNDTSKRVTYYTLGVQEGIELDEVKAKIVDGNRLCIEYDYNYNPEEKMYSSFKAHVACYDANNALVYVRADTWCNVPVGLTATTYELTLPKTVDYDKIKVFLWAKANENEPFPINPVLKSAEIDVVE